MPQNLILARAPPQKMLWKLTAFSQISTWIMGEEKERGRKKLERERMEETPTF